MKNLTCNCGGIIHQSDNADWCDKCDWSQGY